LVHLLLKLLLSRHCRHEDRRSIGHDEVIGRNLDLGTVLLIIKTLPPSHYEIFFVLFKCTVYKWLIEPLPNIIERFRSITYKSGVDGCSRRSNSKKKCFPG
jgi:hypothetical protein